MTVPTVHQESLFVSVNHTDRLHLRHLYSDAPRDPLRAPILMLHGAIENGRIFYSENGKGLAPYLAAQGFDVYVMDMRGRGGSTPNISRASTWGHTQTILEDIPACVNAIRERHGNSPQHWIAHSWGGVLMTSAYVRLPELQTRVASMTYFGTKRVIRARNGPYFFEVALIWNLVCPVLTRLYGYLPAKAWRLGSDNETVRTHRETMQWAKVSPWMDLQDGFDYARAAQALSKEKWPRALYLAAASDTHLGHPDDVRDTMRESGNPNAEYSLLGKANGHLHNYDHVDMLTHPDAVRDHFPMVLSRLRTAA